MSRTIRLKQQPILVHQFYCLVINWIHFSSNATTSPPICQETLTGDSAWIEICGQRVVVVRWTARGFYWRRTLCVKAIFSLKHKSSWETTKLLGIDRRWAAGLHLAELLDENGIRHSCRGTETGNFGPDKKSRFRNTMERQITLTIYQLWTQVPLLVKWVWWIQVKSKRKVCFFCLVILWHALFF